MDKCNDATLVYTFSINFLIKLSSKFYTKRYGNGHRFVDKFPRGDKKGVKVIFET